MARRRVHFSRSDAWVPAWTVLIGVCLLTHAQAGSTPFSTRVRLTCARTTLQTVPDGTATLPCRITWTETTHPPFRMHCATSTPDVICTLRPEVVPLPDAPPGMRDFGILLHVRVMPTVSTGTHLLELQALSGDRMMTRINVTLEVGGITAGTPVGQGMRILTSGTTGLHPRRIVVDARAGNQTTGNLNGILEPGETVQVECTWRNNADTAITASGVISAFFGPSDGIYTVVDGAAA